MRIASWFAAVSAVLVISILAAVQPAPAFAGSDSRRSVVLSLQGLDCQSCWMGDIEPKFKKMKGVKKVSFDRNTVEATFEVDKSVQDAQLVAVVEKAGFKAIVGAGHGAWMPQAEFPEGADVQLVTNRGDDVADLGTLAVADKVTVVEFYAPWCGQCRVLGKHLSERVTTEDEIAVRRINVVDWETPIAKHYLKGISGLPYVVVLGKDGKKVAAIQGLALAKVDQAIAKGGVD